MEITCNHPNSSYGIPIIVENGEVLDYSEGLKKALEILGWSREELAKKSGYSNGRSIEKFFQGSSVPSAQLLNVLKEALEDKAIKEKLQTKHMIELYPPALSAITSDHAEGDHSIESEANRMIECYAHLLANTSITGLFTVNEWSAIFDANNGRMWLATDVFGIAANVADSIGFDEKWEVDVKGLATKIFHLDKARQFKIAETIHEFWTPPSYKGSIEEFLNDRKLLAE